MLASEACYMPELGEAYCNENGITNNRIKPNEKAT